MVVGSRLYPGSVTEKLSLPTQHKVPHSSLEVKNEGTMFGLRKNMPCPRHDEPHKLFSLSTSRVQDSLHFILSTFVWLSRELQSNSVKQQTTCLRICWSDNVKGEHSTCQWTNKLLFFFVLLFIEMTQRATTLNVSASCLGGKKPIDWPRFTLSALFYFSFTRSCPAFFSVKRFIFGQVAYPLPPSPARQQEKRK